MRQLDQGTIFCGIRSEKYPNLQCYGVVISASCDIANEKIKKIYYLLGISASEWFCTEASYRVVYQEKRKNVLDKLIPQFNNSSLDATILQTFSPDEVDSVIDHEVEKDKTRSSLKKEYREYLKFCKEGMSENERRQAIRADSKPAVNFLTRIGKGEIFHYYYLPEKAYLEKNERLNSGLIIDLQEINFISLADALRIVTPGIDKLTLAKEEEHERDRLEKTFWLEKTDDFVDIEGKVTSPWREHLMQSFSRDFARIGIDGAKEADYKQLLERI